MNEVQSFLLSKCDSFFTGNKFDDSLSLKWFFPLIHLQGGSLQAGCCSKIWNYAYMYVLLMYNIYIRNLNPKFKNWFEYSGTQNWLLNHHGQAIVVLALIHCDQGTYFCNQFWVPPLYIKINFWFSHLNSLFIFICSQNHVCILQCKLQAIYVQGFAFFLTHSKRKIYMKP